MQLRDCDWLYVTLGWPMCRGNGAPWSIMTAP